MTILVVDDSPTVLRVAEYVLGDAGYDVVCLEGGRDVVKTAKSTRPDLILLDFAMPGVNGYDVCRELGENRDLDNIPIVVMNTRGDAIGDRFIHEMGILDHLSKPFAPEALLTVVQHTLKKARTDPSMLRRPLLWQQRHDPERAGSAANRLSHAIATAIGNMRRGPKRIERICAMLESPEARRDIIDLLFERADGPALTGDLGTVPIAEVMQLLQLQRQSGFLSVRHGDTLVSIAFKHGEVRLVTGENLPREHLLGNILVQEGFIQADDLDVLLSNRRGTRRRLGTQVVKLGYLDRDQLHTALQRQSSELVYMMLRWGRGRFAFEQREQLPPEVLEFEFGLGIDGLLMEGYRRVDEWGLIEEAIPSFGLVLRPLSLDEQVLGELTDEERRVFEMIDGERTVQQIIDALGWGAFPVASVLYRLVNTKAAEVLEPAAVSAEEPVV